MKYIEIRIILKDNTDMNSKVVKEIAEEVKDILTDYTCDEYDYPIFTQDVTYEIKEDKQ